MRSINGRISKLEHRFGTAHSAPRYLLILMDAGNELGPAEGAYIKSLDEAGLLPISGFGVVDLIHIPDAGARARVAPAAEITVELV
jgi:hypothetical protein